MRDDTRISRRDFLNGALLTAGGLAVSGSVPMHVLAAAQGSANGCDGPVGLDPRVLRGGNLPAAFTVAHWMRDRRLTFTRNAVTIAKGCDSDAGMFDIADGLIRRGYSDADIELILGGNFRRVLGKIWGGKS